MKAKSIFFGLVCMILVASCKNDPKTDETTDTKEVVNNKFKVTLNLLIKKNDSVHVYFTEDNTLNFNEEASVWTYVKGSDEPQDVVFELPEDRFPTLLRLDLGIHPENEKILFKGFKLDYKGKSFAAPENMVYNYFRINSDYTKIDDATKELSRKDPKFGPGPSLYPLEIPLKTEIDKLAK